MITRFVAACALVLGFGSVALAQTPEPKCPSPVSNTEAAEGDFFNRINSNRSSALRINSGIRDQYARPHAQRMADSRAQFSNDNYNSPNTARQLGAKKVGEAVGSGCTVQAVFDEAMKNPQYRSLIADPDFTDVGIGVRIASDGVLYVTQDFAAFGSSPTAPPATARPTSPPAATATAAATPEPTEAAVTPSPTATAPLITPNVTAPPLTTPVPVDDGNQSAAVVGSAVAGVLAGALLVLLLSRFKTPV